MIKISGQVVNIVESSLLLRDKDKDGNRTGQPHEHKSVNIQLMVKESKDSKKIYFALVNLFDPPANLTIPSVGETWDLPAIRKIEFRQGVYNINLL